MIGAVAIACYTNLAGMAIAATPVRIEGADVTFAVGRGERTLPLGVFPTNEQGRIRAELGAWTMPAELKDLAKEIGAQRRRAEARAKAGRLAPGELAETRENLTGSWRHAVEAAKLTPAEKEHWKERLP